MDFIYEHNLDKDQKFLFVLGSTISGIGKGSTMSSIGVLLQSMGLVVNCVKIDPYFNVDAGTMSPYEHGEVFVLDDGGETDLDLGNYERCLGIRLNRDHNITSGKAFLSVIQDERKGHYLGKTVQIIPHVTNRIIEMVMKAAKNITSRDGKKSDICLVEVGGTVGDLEGLVHIEAVRQIVSQLGPSNAAVVLISYVPEVGSINEPKTKPTQQAVSQLRAYGISPNFIICRSSHELDIDIRKKIAFFCNLGVQDVITCYNVFEFWDVSLVLADQEVHTKIMRQLHLSATKCETLKWIRLSEHIRALKKATPTKIVVVGKYIASTDQYYSVMKSLQDASYSCERSLVLTWLDCSFFDVETDNKVFLEKQDTFWKELETADGILVPGGKTVIFIFSFRFWAQRH